MEQQHFDWLGAAFLAVGLSALTLGLSFGQEWGWSSLRFLLSMMLATAALVGTAWVERRAPFPLLDPALLRNRVFVFANVGFTTCMLALFAVDFLLPFYLEELQGYNTLQVRATAHAALAGGGGAPQRGSRGSCGIALACAARAGRRLRGPATLEPVGSCQLDLLPH